MALKVASDIKGTEQLLTFEGSIDEDVADITAPQASMASYIIDLNGITLINSIGIRTWCEWIQRFPAGKPIRLKRVPKAVVTQINSVKGFLPVDAKVESVYLPLFCDKCEKQSNVLVECKGMAVVSKEAIAAVLKGSLSAICKESACESEPDVNLERYFNFNR
jgi:hypothetical protein